MHLLYSVLYCIFTFFFITACGKQKKESGHLPAAPQFQAHDTAYPVSSELQITEQTESLYQTFMEMSGKRIAIYKAGTDTLQEVTAPETFRELAVKLQKEWTIPSDDFSHPVMQFLVALHKITPLRFREGAIRNHNVNSFLFAYSFLTGELRTSVLLDTLKAYLGGEFSSFMDDPDCDLTWSDDCRSLVLQAKKNQKKIAVVPREDQIQCFSQNQKVKPIVFTPDELHMMEKEYSGRVHLTDNSLGRITDVFLFHNHYLPYKTLLSTWRCLDASITIVTHPQSQLMYYVDRCVQMVEQGRPDSDFMKRILGQQSHLASRYKEAFESLCKEDAIRQMQENKTLYICRWKELQDKIFLDEVKNHEENLRNRLVSDGIDVRRLTIITSKQLEIHWARDYFLLGSTGKRKPLFLESALPLDVRNKNLAKELVQHPALKNRWKIRDIGLPFEGGDIRAVGQFLFIGENTFTNGIRKIQRHIESHGAIRIGVKLCTSKELNVIDTLVRNEYKELFGREFVLVGEGDNFPQASVHIDMFLTFLPNPGDKPTVVVADINESISLMQNLSAEESAQVERSMLRASLTPQELNRSSPFWLYRGLFMHHDFIEILMHGGLPRYITTYKKSQKAEELRQRLDAAALWFQERGYSVVRAPSAVLQLGYINYWSQRNGIAILQTLKDNAQRVYNNVLVEVYIDSAQVLHRTIYMPYYGIIPLEKRLIDIYNNLGYRVVFVPYMWEPAFGGGAFNCLTTEIRGRFLEPKH
ncbi:MAG: hypothetical protein JW795_12750 [Chitinivibrionales bacterium]|nr:hypothetical protein [Chitinivibrionales bacterium]